MKFCVPLLQKEGKVKFYYAVQMTIIKTLIPVDLFLGYNASGVIQTNQINQNAGTFNT